MSFGLLHFVVTGALAAASGSEQAAPFLRLDKPTRGVLAAGFELERDTEVRIEALGLVESTGLGRSLWPFGRSEETGKERPYIVRAWILDGATRKPVWMQEADPSVIEGGSSRLRRADARIRLVAGPYELYVSSEVEGERSEKTARSQPWWQQTIEYLSGDFEPLVTQCFAALSADSLRPSDVKRHEVDGDLPGALIRLNRTGDSALRSAGFELRGPATLRLYGILEQVPGSDEASDFGWIVDAATRRPVWQCWRGDHAHAGGAAKNRLVDETVRLEAGRYLLSYGTDDSHSFPSFNASPPHDPFNWGITLMPGPGFEPASFTTFTPETPDPLVALTEVGDNETLERPFHLDRDANVRVHAMGERTSHGRLADFAEIVEPRTGTAVWKMSAADTIPAGGSRKNRLFDGLVRLRRGDYVLRYRTDDSHSYPHWNAPAPFEPRQWGVSLFPAD